jgi:glyoxylase-like metal-dependent hydrolase (beta-lactamase superfamily II)
MAVNAYVISSGDAVVMVDTGFASRANDLLTGLEDVGFSASDVDHVFYTHTHIDHMGGGVALGDRLGGEHHVVRGCVPALGDYYDYFASLQSWSEWVGEAIPAGAFHDRLVAFFERPQAEAPPGSRSLVRVREVAIGESVRAGDLNLVCVDAHGHDPFHVVWYEPDRRWLFSGDVILPVLTPLIPPHKDDISAYRASLRRIGTELDVAVMFPGHGRPRTDFEAAWRASDDALAALYRKVVRVLDGGAVSLLDFVGEVDTNDGGAMRRAFIAVACVASQLDELVRRGYVAREGARRWRAIGVLPEYERYATE